MLHVGAFLSYILIAAIGSAAGSPALETPFSFRADAAPRSFFADGIFPNDTVYVEYSASPSHLTLSTVEVLSFSQRTFETCQYEASSRDAGYFKFNASNGKCIIGVLQFKLCRTRQGEGGIPIYIQEPLLTDGTDNDGTIAEQIYVSPQLRNKLSNPDGAYGTFRVESPTILNFPDYYTSTDIISKQTIFTENNDLVEVNDGIIVDPVCYTNNACAVPFVYARTTAIVPSNLAWLSKSCGQLITVTQGQPRYILSHEGIGCEKFPDSGYGSGTCTANYRGYSDSGIKISVEFVNFKDGDSCDGFYLNIVSFNTQTDKTMTRLCGTSGTEIYSPVSRGRIDFSGVAKAGRSKYGFIITLRDA